MYIQPKSNPQSAAASPFIGGTRPPTCKEDNILVFLLHRVPLYTQVPMPLLSPYSIRLSPISAFSSMNLTEITAGTAAACCPEVFHSSVERKCQKVKVEGDQTSPHL